MIGLHISELPATGYWHIIDLMTDAIILFSHGSVLCGAGETLRELAERMRERGDAPMVEVGYLNYSEPAFEATFERCVAAGARRITIAPYFLVAGKFVKVDLPRKIQAVIARHPEVEARVADAMRFHPGLADALLACAGRAVRPSEWRRTLETASQFCRVDERCPLYGTPTCKVTQKELAA